MQDSTLVATGSSDKLIRVWDIRSRKPLIKVFKGHSDSVLCLDWLSQDRTIVSGSRDRTIRVWVRNSTRLVLVSL